MSQEAEKAPLPEVFVYFRDLIRIHLKQILKLDRKPPMHAATLIVLVACETLSTRFERPDDCDMFARDLLTERGIPYEVGKVIFNALRHSLAHTYSTGRIVLGRDEIRPTLNWKGDHGVHLLLTGVEARDGHLHIVPVDQNKDRHFRLSINVEELWKDLDALFKRLETELRADPDLAAKVQKRAAAARLGDTKRIQPAGPAREVWRAYLQSARWEGPQPPAGRERGV